jgi:hypothetical protein
MKLKSSEKAVKIKQSKKTLTEKQPKKWIRDYGLGPYQR